MGILNRTHTYDVTAVRKDVGWTHSGAYYIVKFPVSFFPFPLSQVSVPKVFGSSAEAKAPNPATSTTNFRHPTQ